jgi:hypothetical protein
LSKRLDHPLLVILVFWLAIIFAGFGLVSAKSTL